MVERGPLSYESEAPILEEIPVSTWRREIAKSVGLSLVIFVASWVIAVVLLFAGFETPYLILDLIIFLEGALFFLQSTVTLAFGSSPVLSHFKARLLGTRREIVPHEITFRRGVGQLLSGILLIFFASLGL